jgi:hypothetical protein
VKHQIGVILLAVLGFSPAPAARTASTNPCVHSTLPVASAALYEALTQSEGAEALKKIVQRANSLMSQAEKPHELVCLAYILGSADFLRSARGEHMIRHAFGAVRWFAYAQAVAPESMTGRQARNRTRASWRRLGKQPNWLAKNAFTTVALPTAPKDGRIILMPPKASMSSICGTRADCSPQIELPILGHRQGEITLLKGRYRVGLRTKCGTRMLEGTFKVNGGLLPTVKEPACAVSIVPKDGKRIIDTVEFLTERGRVIPPQLINNESPVLIMKAKGYKTVRITPSQTGTREIQMLRCSVKIDVTTTPPRATIKGDHAGPWGLRRLTVSHPGHGSISRDIDIGMPTDCESDASFKTHIILPRFVILQVRNQAGEAITLNELFIDGRAVTPLSFAVSPGRHTFTATHHALGQQNGVLDVNSCLTNECPPKVLTIDFSTSPSVSAQSNGPRILYITAGTLLAAGLVSGAFAISTNHQLRDYTDKRSENISAADLRDKQTLFARTADTLFLSSAVSLVSAVAWQYAGGGQ